MKLLCGGLVAVASTAGLVLGTAAPAPPGSKRAAELEEPRWLASNPGKRWTEICFGYLSALWIVWFGLIVATGVYEQFGPWSYFIVCSAMAVPYAVAPLFFPGQGEPEVPLLQRTWVKANIWIAIISYVGNYFWTHYFYNLLGAGYTFDAWRINNVPICLFLATHAYFCFYHTMTTILLRRFWTSHIYQRTASWVKPLASAVLVLVMADVTAFMETWTISSFPYYTIRDRFYMYTVGSVCYGIYFIVSFPAYYRLDEGTERWTCAQAAIDSLGSCMAVTIMLDLWRLTMGSVLPNVPDCVPYM